jgi:hypothetical protein
LISPFADQDFFKITFCLAFEFGFEDGNVSEPPADVFATSVGDVVVAEDVPASELADVSPLIDAAPVFPVAATESQAEAPQATESTDQIDIAASALPTVPRPPLISDEALRNMGFVTREMQPPLPVSGPRPASRTRKTPQRNSVSTSSIPRATSTSQPK